MQFSFVAIAALLAAVANSAPRPVTPIPDRRDTFSYESSQNQVNDCGDSTFINQSSGGSPKVSDCRQLAANIAGGGTWTTAAGVTRTLATYGTCGFIVRPDESEHAWYAKVGNQDIIDLINTSISKFSWNNLVGAKGRMNCQAVPSGGDEVAWGIYHT